MMVRTEADPPVLEAGTAVQIEVGARWTTDQGGTHRVGGHWVECIVVRDTPRELLVRLA
ncbi:MAG TPA: hypothetical protein VEA16_16140 [Vicinamibacterales bacterium]|nr:hypothetical protein [Vicinamibacterales bacterium]